MYCDWLTLFMRWRSCRFCFSWNWTTGGGIYASYYNNQQLTGKLTFYLLLIRTCCWLHTLKLACITPSKYLLNHDLVGASEASNFHDHHELSVKMIDTMHIGVKLLHLSCVSTDDTHTILLFSRLITS